ALPARRPGRRCRCGLATPRPPPAAAGRGKRRRSAFSQRQTPAPARSRRDSGAGIPAPGRRGSRAVSYTHLDVYKRQIRCWWWRTTRTTTLCWAAQGRCAATPSATKAIPTIR
ncbi:hypothetical protein AZZ99_001543, partial [Serratia marcescens]